MEQIVLFLVTGALAGLLAGMFGIGGGMLIVPALVWLLPRQGVDGAVAVQVAIGTSLAVIAITSLSSTLAHHRRGGVRWDVMRRLTPGLVVGAVGGAFVAHALPGATLKIVVGVGAVITAIQMLLNRGSAADASGARGPGAVELTGAGGIIGLLSSVIGIGGGSITVPYLTLRGIGMREAVGTAAACGLPIAWAGAVGFMIAGHGLPGLPPWSVGYVSLAGFVGISFASVLTAPQGAKLAHTLPPRTLKRIFAVFLLLIGARMLTS